MIDAVLQVLGLVVICYGVWRLVVLFLDDYEARSELRDVMEGRREAPWEPTTVKVRPPLYDRDNDI